MRAFVSQVRYDSELSVQHVGPNHHADLTIIVRIAMHEYFPGNNIRLDTLFGGGRAQFQGQDIAFEDEDGRQVSLTPWPAGQFAPFCRRYKEKVEWFWNNKLWLVPSGAWGAARPGPAGTDTLIVPGVRCRLRVEIVTDNEHVHCDIAHLATSTEFRTSTTPSSEPHHRDRVLCIDEFTSSSRLKADSRDLTPKRVYGQLAAVHEMGHYLGLHHVCGRGNDIANYGVTDYEKRSVMGRGMEFRPAHAWPWKNRLLQHSLSAGQVQWHGVTERPRPQLIRVRASRRGSGGGDEHHGVPVLDGGIASTGGTMGPRRPGPIGREV